MINPQRLVVLQAVVASGSIHAAARNLNYSPATISQHMSALSRETGLVLFEKAGRGIVPTVAAISLSNDASTVLASMRRLDRTIDDLHKGPRDHLAIACFTSVMQAWIPELVATMRTRYSQLTVEISLNEPHDGKGRHHPDLDIRSEPGDGEPLHLDGYARHPIMIEDFLVAFPRDHRFAQLDAVPLAELRDEPWIDHDLYNSPTGQIIATATRSAGFVPQWAARLDDHHAALSLVSAGVGIALLPRLALATMPAHLEARVVTKPEVLRGIVAHTTLEPRRNVLVAGALESLIAAANRDGMG